MTQKPFEDLTISDDFMFCKVMEYAPICKEFLEILFSVKIEKITYLSPQNTVTTNSEAKTVRLDVLVKDKAGTSYDIEMCFPIDVRVYRKNIAAAWNQGRFLGWNPKSSFFFWGL